MMKSGKTGQPSVSPISKKAVDTMRVGLFGGLFDPPHIGHLIIAQHVTEEFHLDKMLFIPAGNPPHKHHYSPYDTRYTMTELAIAGNKKFFMSDVEKKMPDKTYTIEVIKALRAGSDDELYLIIGSDQWREIETWKEPEALFKECRIVVVRRPHYDLSKEAKFYDRIMTSTAPMIDISSTNIRARIQKNLSVRYLTTASVEKYIAQNNLYKD
jgi:nicotinate-nucleotide adenylyltransferase